MLHADKVGIEANVYEVGTRVRHNHFGDGTIESVDMAHKCYEIRFDRLETTRSILMKIRLEKI